MSVDSFREYSERVTDSLDTVQDIGWNEDVANVLVILSASRSGSSLVFNALSTSPNIVAPAGEHEPWLFLSENKFPFTQSDQIEIINNKELLLRLLRNDMLIRESEVDSQEYLLLLRNRMRVRGLILSRDIEDEVLADNVVGSVVHQYLQQRNFGFDHFLPVPNSIRQLTSGDHVYPVENPPYIDIPIARRANTEELKSRTLLFKSPSDAYRAGLYEELFPNAKIKYVHLTRGYAQTINGIMDGWLAAKDAFISNGVGLTGRKLNIAGYTQDQQTSNYWCFDLFPGWENFSNTDLLTIGAMQWATAHRAILRDFHSVGGIKFEKLYSDKDEFIKQLEQTTGTKTEPKVWEIPVMATHAPRQARWKTREGIFERIRELIRVDIVNELMEVNEAMGYSEEPSTWL